MSDSQKIISEIDEIGRKHYVLDHICWIDEAAHFTEAQIAFFKSDRPFKMDYPVQWTHRRWPTI